MSKLDLKNLNWTTIAEIESAGKLSCIDGRHTQCVVGAPGGNIGEIILILSAAEHLTNIEFNNDQIEQLLVNYASTFGQFYMHTDTHAVREMLQTISHDTELANWANDYLGDVDSFFSDIAVLDKTKADLLMPYLLMPQHIGCGHIKLLTTNAEQYQVRPQLVTHIIKSFFRLMWLGNKSMHWEMLDGDHHEKQVVVIDGEQDLVGESVIPFACHSDNEQQFVHHSAARRFFHKRDAMFIRNFMDYLDLASPTLADFIEKIERQADLQLNHTLNALAKDLPIIRVVVEGNDLRTDNAA